MFKVYGVTLETAKNAAEKAIKRLPKKEQPTTPGDYQKLFLERTEHEFEKMKPVVIGKPFDAPEFAQQLIDLTKRTTRARGLHIRINTPALDNKGGVIINKRTKKPSMTWEKYDPSKDYYAALQRAKDAVEEFLKAA